MGGQKFQYDENGGTFFYFLLSFLALLLIPGTYYWWPRKQKKDPELDEKECHCEPCLRKRSLLKSKEPWQGAKELVVKLIIVLGWVILALLAYKVSQFDYEYANFDPYDILGVPPTASVDVIKKSYKKLSLIYHPDKRTGDEKKFMMLTKAYQALTDDEARRNWEKYGSPDGPGAMSFGIALPSWIVEKENSFWVLGLYALVFMVALPTAVGIWWYRSMRYSGDQVLMDTTQIYYYFIHKTPSMTLKRVIMILGASLEFEKKFNSEIVERASDNMEVPQLIKQIPNLGEKNREKPLCYMYSLKARALLHAHLSRMSLNPMTLDKDRMLIVKKCPILIQEMVNVVAQLVMLAYANRISRLPTIETIEYCMKLCPMIVQGLWDKKSPLLQLPFLTEDHIRKNFQTKKRQIKTIQQFIQLKSDERRQVCRFLSDEQYNDLMKVAGKMPLIDFQVRTEVIDDEVSTVITVCSVVTVTVTLIRKEMKGLFGDDTVQDKHCPTEMGEQGDAPEAVNGEEENAKEQQKKPVWQKQQRKAPKKTGKKEKKKPSHKEKDGKLPPPPPANSQKKEDSQEPEKSPKVEKKPSQENEDSSADESDISDDEPDRSDDEGSMDEKKGSSLEDDDDWEKFQTGIGKRDRVLEGRSKLSHTVHCPYFPEEKQEYWWVYICDRKSRTLLCSPYHVTNLVDREEIQLKFTAPRWAKVVTVTVCLRSDSYIGFDQTHDIKLDVKEAPEVPEDHPQWEMLDEEEDDKPDDGPSGVSEYTSDEDVEDV